MRRETHWCVLIFGKNEVIRKIKQVLSFFYCRSKISVVQSKKLGSLKNFTDYKFEEFQWNDGEGEAEQNKTKFLFVFRSGVVKVQFTTSPLERRIKLCPVSYFGFKNKGDLRICKTTFGEFQEL